MGKPIVCPYGCGKEWVGSANRRAAQPLDADAVQAANQEVWSNCARLTSADGTQRQLTMDADDRFCRRVWMDAYVAELAKKKAAPPPAPANNPANPVLPCDKANLAVKVADDQHRPVENATVTAMGLGTKVTDNSGYATFDDIAPGDYLVTASKADHARASGQMPGPVTAAARAPACATTVVNLQLVPICSAATIKSKLAACDGGNNLWEKAKTAFGHDPVVRVGPAAGGFKADTDPVSGVITITPTSDCCSAASSLCFELTNAGSRARFNAIDNDAAAGNVAREDFVRRTARVEYDGLMIRQRAFNACRATWGCSATATTGFENLSPNFDTYYDSQATEGYKDYYRNAWDRTYKAAYDAKHRAAP